MCDVRKQNKKKKIVSKFARIHMRFMLMFVSQSESEHQSFLFGIVLYFETYQNSQQTVDKDHI